MEEKYKQAGYETKMENKSGIPTHLLIEDLYLPKDSLLYATVGMIQ